MATFSASTFSAAGYLKFRPSYPSWVYDLIAQYHATGQISAQALLAAQHKGASGASIRAPPPKQGVHWDRALDLGCGPGIGSLPLLSVFDSVVALDPSQKMIDQALRDPLDPSLPQHIRPQVLDPSSARSSVTHAPARRQIGSMHYLVDNALSLTNYLRENGVKGPDDPVPDEAKVDLVVSFQAAHWFTPYSDLWRTIDRVLKPGGTALCIIYSEFYLPEYPSLTKLITEYVMGEPLPHPTDGLGPYWEAGRQILNHGMIDMPAPWVVLPNSTGWDRNSFVRRVFSNQEGTNSTDRWAAQSIPAPEKEGAQGGDPVPPAELDAAEQLIMTKPADWDTLRGYLSTFSSLHNYRRAHPDDEKNQGGIAERFLQRLRAAMLDLQRAKNSDATLSQHFTLQWPVHVVGVKKAPQ